MSVVAAQRVHGGWEVAYDTRVVDSAGDAYFETCEPKAWSIGEHELVGVVGDATVECRARLAVKGGGPKKVFEQVCKMLKSAGEVDFNLIYIHGGRLYLIAGFPISMSEPRRGYFSIGAGSAWADGHLWGQGCVEDAVRCAIDHCWSCGGEPQVLFIPDPEGFVGPVS